MKEFETIGPDGLMYLHQDNWHRWRSNRLWEYPCPLGHYRFDIEIAHPRDFIDEVPVERNPHSLGGYDAWTVFYHSNNWSTIFGVHDSHSPWHFGENYRMLVESGCPDPVWGERITLMSTSSIIECEPWGHNVANKFAYFRGKYWRIIKWEFLHAWTPLYSAIRDEIGLYDLRPVPVPRRRFSVWHDHPVRTNRAIEAVRRSLARLRFTPAWCNQQDDVSWEEEGF